MTMPPEISTALVLLQAEHAKLVEQIADLHKRYTALAGDLVPTFDELMAIYRRRDRLANALNNLKAYYDGD